MQKALYSINSIIRKFGKCSDSVKITLFRTYCTTMYTPHLWWNHTKVSIKKLQVAYNNIFRVLCHEDKFCSASLMFVSRDIPTFNELQRKNVFNFVCKIEKSGYNLVNTIVHGSDAKYDSPIWKHWLEMLYVYHDSGVM